jgi:hypothetical protein
MRSYSQSHPKVIPPFQPILNDVDVIQDRMKKMIVSVVNMHYNSSVSDDSQLLIDTLTNQSDQIIYEYTNEKYHPVLLGDLKKRCFIERVKEYLSTGLDLNYKCKKNDAEPAECLMALVENPDLRTQFPIFKLLVENGAWMANGRNIIRTLLNYESNYEVEPDLIEYMLTKGNIVFPEDFLIRAPTRLFTKTIIQAVIKQRLLYNLAVTGKAMNSAISVKTFRSMAKAGMVLTSTSKSAKQLEPIDSALRDYPQYLDVFVEAGLKPVEPIEEAIYDPDTGRIIETCCRYNWRSVITLSMIERALHLFDNLRYHFDRSALSSSDALQWMIFTTPEHQLSSVNRILKAYYRVTPLPAENTLVTGTTTHRRYGYTRPIYSVANTVTDMKTIRNHALYIYQKYMIMKSIKCIPNSHLFSQPPPLNTIPGLVDTINNILNHIVSECIDNAQGSVDRIVFDNYNGTCYYILKEYFPEDFKTVESWDETMVIRKSSIYHALSTEKEFTVMCLIIWIRNNPSFSNHAAILSLIPNELLMQIFYHYLLF